MGEVYRARDTALHGDVALKILPDAFSADPDRLARFTREAQVLASLSHTNMAAIYGLENARWCWSWWKTPHLPINVVLNWFDELKRLVPTGRH